ncbi:Uncharacterised protein [Enterobacter hormaechei]|nr:Uncharacterised protein [Enterobacter hormaechei]
MKKKEWRMSKKRSRALKVMLFILLMVVSTSVY